MKTVTEIRTEAIRVINTIITLKSNVFNGCNSDRDELTKQMARLDGIKKWAIENNQLPEIKNYFISKNFGQHNQFSAQELSKFFNN